MTITKTVEITDSRRLHLDFDIPREVPAGKAQVELKVIPFVKKEDKPEPPLKSLVGAATPLADSLLGIFSRIGDVDLEEIRAERLAKFNIDRL